MSLQSRFSQAGMVARVAVSDPLELANLPRLAKTRGRTTLDLRNPWLPFDLIDALVAELSPDDRVFEYGGGGSTAFFADHVGHVTAVEHDPDWARAIADAVGEAPNVLVRHQSLEGEGDAYVASIDEEDDESLSLVLVDGRCRVRCLRRAAPKVAPGGLIVLDDSDRARYRESFEILREWERTDYSGFAPTSVHSIGHSSVWRKPRTDR